VLSFALNCFPGGTELIVELIESHSAARLQGLLDSFAREIEGIRAVVVGDPKGLPVASLVRGPNAMATTAMATLLLSAARNVATSLELAGISDMILEGKGWLILLRPLGENFTLLVLAGEDVNLGLLKLQAERRASEAWQLIEEMR